MRKPFQITGHSTRLFLLALTLLVGGCAAPQTPNDLQQRVEELLKIQQQQALKLTELSQQLARFQSNPGPLTEKSNEVATENQPPAQTSEQPQPNGPPTADTAKISEAAELYLEAFAAIATGQMPEAESSFRKFIQRYPNHEYLGNANYWLAESLLAQQKNKEAETLLLHIIDDPRQQNKAPAAMARLVKYYRETNADDSANAMLQMLKNYYPESPELKRLMRSPETR